MIELTPHQEAIAKRLASNAKAYGIIFKIQVKKADERHFRIIVARYYERMGSMTKELENCFSWLDHKGLKMFTAHRFRNWCDRYMHMAKQDQIDRYERKKLKHGNEHQQAEYSRLFK